MSTTISAIREIDQSLKDKGRDLKLTDVLAVMDSSGNVILRPIQIHIEEAIRILQEMFLSRADEFAQLSKEEVINIVDEEIKKRRKKEAADLLDKVLDEHIDDELSRLPEEELMKCIDDQIQEVRTERKKKCHSSLNESRR